MASTASDIPQDILLSLQEKYEKVRKLLDEDSKKDPESEPYRSKYKAQSLLNDMKSILINYLDDTSNSESNKVKVHAMLGIVWLNLGIISLETEEPSTSEEQLTKCVETLDEYAMDPTVIVILVNALNQLSVLWSERDDPQKAKTFLERSEKLYKDYMQNIGASKSPVPTWALFGMSGSISKSEDGDVQLEKAHTHTLYFLAQIYGALKQTLRSAVYCHNTLKRQLESKDYDPIDWALNAATLSQFFATHNGFSESRHHLAAASTVLDQYAESLRGQSHESEEERDARMETLRHRTADVSRCWAKYGLNLLSLSQARLLRLAASEPGEPTPPASLEDGSLALTSLAPESGVDVGQLENLRFNSLELSTYENQVSAKPANVFDEAKELFVNSKDWLTRAKEYYTMDHHASDAVEIIQDMSRLYQNLVFFEENEERQSRMHKRRVDMLEEALAQLNPQYYLYVCRQLWFELAETYLDMLDIKKQRLRSSSSDGPPNPQALSKINTLTKHGITHLNSFLDSVKPKGCTTLPDEFSEDLERPVLLAFFYLGKLYREQVTPDKQLQADQTRQSLAAYQFLVDYCSKHESARAQMGAELGISREMLELLPAKLQRLAEV